jgi:hypothetical protein
MTRLIRQAPPELQAIYGSDMANPSIDSMSFDYRSVAVNRPWIRSELFKARFWRLGPAGGELSDGGTPPQGRCPAYITALVFARNVTIQRRQTGISGEKLQKPETLLMLGPHLKLQQLNLAQDVRVPPRMVPEVDSTTMRLAGVPQLRVMAGMAVRPARTTRVMDTAARRVIGPQQALVLKSHTFRELEHVPGRRPLPTPAPAPTPAPSTDEVTILAFICKRLPALCPDPDPALTWV